MSDRQMVSRGIVVFGGVNSVRPEADKAWAAYAGGVILILDRNGNLDRRLVYDKRPGVLGDIPGVGVVVKSGCLDGSSAVICTTTDVMRVDLESGDVLAHCTHPKFNDLHHALPTTSGDLLVVSTGIDSVLRVSWSGELLQAWPMSDRAPSMLEDPHDYRLVLSTKPHQVHPNHVFVTDSGQIYATRFAQQDAICITDSLRPFLEPGIGNLHDGLTRDGEVWFTGTSGIVSAVDAQSGRPVRTFDISSMLKSDRPPGWCRGLAFLDDDTVAIGFSRLRHTKFKENVKWIANKFGASSLSPHPTRIVFFDIRNERVTGQVDLEQAGGMNAVFSICANP
jgi:hypothetical protein